MAVYVILKASLFEIELAATFWTEIFFRLIEMYLVQMFFKVEMSRILFIAAQEFALEYFLRYFLSLFTVSSVSEL